MILWVVEVISGDNNLLLAECEVGTASYGPSFSLPFMAQARRPWKQGRKKWGSITCPTDWANEANKMFIIWLCWLFRFWNGDQELEVRTATYEPGIDQSQHAKSVSHIIMINYLIQFVRYLLCQALLMSNIVIFNMVAVYLSVVIN